MTLLIRCRDAAEIRGELGSDPNFDGVSPFGFSTESRHDDSIRLTRSALRYALTS